MSQPTYVLTNGDARIPEFQRSNNLPAGILENTGTVPEQLSSFPLPPSLTETGVEAESSEGVPRQVHLPNSIEDIKRIELPLSKTATQWSPQDQAFIANTLTWQDLEVSRWIMRRARAYFDARNWPPESCTFQAALDWELWRRRAYIPELDFRNPNPSRERAAEEYLYQLATLENR